MIQIFVIILLAVNINCYYIGNVTLSKLRISGDEYDNVRNIPYMAQILLKKKLLCGGSIVAENWILTAAHCFDDLMATNHFQILTGTSKKEGADGQLHPIKQIYKNKNYNQKDPDADHDIALVQLTEPMKFSKVQKAIKIRGLPPMIGEELKIAGYGLVNKKHDLSPILKSSEVPVIESQKCQMFFKGTITDNMFCAGTGESDACEGDSGGPATINDELVGIISTGAMCASGQYPGVYTKVYNYIDWIEKWSGYAIRIERPRPSENNRPPVPKEQYVPMGPSSPGNNYPSAPPNEQYPPKSRPPKNNHNPNLPPRVPPPKLFPNIPLPPGWPRPPMPPAPPAPPLPLLSPNFPHGAKAAFPHEILGNINRVKAISTQEMSYHGRQTVNQAVIYV